MYSPVPFDVRALGFQAHDVLLGQLQLGRVFDRDDPLLVGDEIAQAIEQRGLAGAGAAGDEDVPPPEHGRPQKLGRRAGHRALGDQIVDDQLPLGKLANRERRAAHRQRRDHGVHAAAVGEPGIDQRLRAVDAPADVGHDPLDDRFDHRVGDEPPAGVLQVAAALDVNVLPVDDHDFRHVRQPQQIFERPVAEDDVLQFLLEIPQGEVRLEALVDAVADRVPRRPELLLHGVDALR